MKHICLLIALLAFVLCGCSHTEHPESITMSYPLVQIGVKSTTQGSGSFIFHFSFDTKPRYRFMVKNQDGSLRMGEVSSFNTPIFYTDDQPRIEISAVFPEDWRGEYINRRVAELYAGFDQYNLRHLPYTSNIKIFVPEGSVREGYEIDATK